MAVRIRLMRMGSKRRPFFRFVVADSRGKRDGGFLDEIGTYNPIAVPHEIKLDEDKLFEWLRKGAEMSEAARSLLKKHGTLARWDVAQGKPGAVKAMEAREAAAAAVAAAGPTPEVGPAATAEASEPAAEVPKPEVAAEASEQAPEAPKPEVAKEAGDEAGEDVKEVAAEEPTEEASEQVTEEVTDEPEKPEDTSTA